MMSAPACVAGRWHGCFDTFNGVVLLTLAALPLAALVVWALARRRRAAGVMSAWRISLAEVGMVYGTVPFLWMTLMPGGGAGTAPARVSLVPLRDLATMGPLGGTVTVHTEARHGASVLRVENTGPAAPPELVPTLTEPFQRGTERVHTDEHAGVGSAWPSCTGSSVPMTGPSTSSPAPPAASSPRSGFPARRSRRGSGMPPRRQLSEPSVCAPASGAAADCAAGAV